MPATDTYAVIPDRKRQLIPDNEKVTLKSIRDQIPKEMFIQSNAKSFYYLARDLVQVAVTYYVFSTYGLPLIDAMCQTLGEGSMLANVAKFVIWNIFWVIQGLNFTGLWVLAHECGHGGFSPSRTINDSLGMILHSALLVPYHSWRISHGNHHKHTNHTELDTVFIPEKVGNHAAREAIQESPIVSLIYMLLTFTLGWPLYLTTNMTGQKYNKRTNHFEPGSPLFRPNEGKYIVQSDMGIFVTFAIFGALLYTGTATKMDIVCWYTIPYMWNNFWLIFITYLQHSDVRLPHYNAENWTFLRGALCTIDRDFGAPINWWIHHINDSHIVHHIFSSMPFYNAIHVTRKYLYKTDAKDYCLSDNRSLWAMLWESWTNCTAITVADGVCWFKQ